MKKIFMGMVLIALLLCVAGCGGEKQYQKEITEAFRKTNEQESARYVYKNSYTNAEGVSAARQIEGAYNKGEETWSQISSYGTQNTGKAEQVFSPQGIYIRYDLDGAGWGKWGTLDTELPDYASYLKTLFEPELSFENFAAIEKTKKDKTVIYTMTYEKSYMEQRVKDELVAAQNYLEILETGSAGGEEVKTMQEKVQKLEQMAGASGQVLYFTDEKGNLTGMESKMTMEDGSSTSASLHLTEIGAVSFADYTTAP